MVIIFVLLVFVLAQAFLSVALSGRDQALDRLNRQVAELSDMLALERGRSTDLRLSLAQVNRDLQTTAAARDDLGQQLSGLKSDQDKLAAERDALKAEREHLSARLADAVLQTQAARARAEELTTQMAEAARRTEALSQETAAAVAPLAEVRRQLAARGTDLSEAQRRLADTETKLETSGRDLAARTAEVDQMRRQLAETIRQSDAGTQDLARLAEQVRALTALRDDLEKQAREAGARVATEAQARAAAAAQAEEEKRLGDSARAQLALLNRQLDELRAQLSGLQKALDLAEVSGRDKDVKIADLGSQLNAALARKVEELQRYRSDFFGKLREVLANRPGIQVVGDRFVFQSEVLFAVGSAELTAAGADEINKLADTLKQISAQIPKDISWVLRVDGHADRQRIEAGRWGSNWELSAGRAITVIKLLIANGIPPNRLAATGFAENQPLDPADTPEAYARNRRIEIRLTDR
jgi:chemotaxis protein MotB